MSASEQVVLPDFREFHCHEFDDDVRRIHAFVSNLSPDIRPTPMDRITVVSAAEAEEFKTIFDIDDAYGMFCHSTKMGEVNQGSIFVINPDTGKPFTDTVDRSRGLAHELTHSITFTPSRSYHRFFAETLAGFGEVAWLRAMQANGEFKPVVTTYLFREYDDDVAYVEVAGEIRSIDARDSNPNARKPAAASPGSMGALAVESAIKQLGYETTVGKLIRDSHPGDRTGLELMRTILNTLRASLAAVVEATPQYSSEGEIEAVYRIQQAIEGYQTSG